jgi:integrase/recombinase XerC
MGIEKIKPKVSIISTVKTPDDDYCLPIQVKSFLVDRRTRNFTKGTMKFYRAKLKVFLDYCGDQNINNLLDINANLLRGYLINLEDTGHNTGGRRACLRAVKTFLRWWETEIQPENWEQPFQKGRIVLPKEDVVPLAAVDLKVVNAMLRTCATGTYYGDRDRAIIFMLRDTGVRAQELCDLNIRDINLADRQALVINGKGRKTRVVFYSKDTAHALRAYIKKWRRDKHEALWTYKDNNSRLTYWGLRQVIRRRAKLAHVAVPSLHSFRRLFALQMIRGKADLNTLRRLMGHADLTILNRYINQTADDIRDVYDQAWSMAEWRIDDDYS